MYWDSRFPDIDVEYVADLPNYSQFWNEIEKNSLVVIDDLWTAASNNEHVSNAFKVYSKKQGFSIIIVTQVGPVDKFSINYFLEFFWIGQVLTKYTTEFWSGRIIWELWKLLN